MKKLYELSLYFVIILAICFCVGTVLGYFETSGISAYLQERPILAGCVGITIIVLALLAIRILSKLVVPNVKISN